MILNINTQNLVYNIYYMAKYTKYDVLKLLANKKAFYAATQWLKTPNEKLGNEAPSDLMNEGKIDAVYVELKKEIKSKKK